MIDKIDPITIRDIDPIDTTFKLFKLNVTQFMSRTRKKLLNLKMLPRIDTEKTKTESKFSSLKSDMNMLKRHRREERDLVMVNDSLKIKQDRESCLKMTTLNEFESYFASTYIFGGKLVQDLLSPNHIVMRIA